jgi:hypothetical protein
VNAKRECPYGHRPLFAASVAFARAEARCLDPSAMWSAQLPTTTVRSERQLEELAPRRVSPTQRGGHRASAARAEGQLSKRGVAAQGGRPSNGWPAHRGSARTAAPATATRPAPTQAPRSCLRRSQQRRCRSPPAAAEARGARAHREQACIGTYTRPCSKSRAFGYVKDRIAGSLARASAPSSTQLIAPLETNAGHTRAAAGRAAHLPISQQM